MEDKRIIELFFERSEKAIEESGKKYGGYISSVAFSILASNEDTEEVVNDTYLRAWNSIPPQKPNKLGAFLSTIARNLALDRYASRRKERENIAAEAVLDELADCLPDTGGLSVVDEIVLFGGEDAVAEKVIKDTAEQKGSPVFTVDYSKLTVKKATLEGSVFDFENRSDLNIRLLGTYQPRNASVVLKAVDILCDNGMEIPEAAVRRGLADARWIGRFEILSKQPLTIFDGAHNPEGIDSAVESIKKYFGNERVYVLTGVLKDKDYEYIASRLSEIGDKAFTLTPDNPRALDSGEYADVLCKNGLSARGFNSLKEAYQAAKSEAQKDGKALVCLGSLYTYSELINLI